MIALTDILDLQADAAKAIALARSHVTDMFEAKSYDSRLEAYALAMMELQHAELAVDGIENSARSAGGTTSDETKQADQAAA